MNRMGCSSTEKPWQRRSVFILLIATVFSGTGHWISSAQNVAQKITNVVQSDGVEMWSRPLSGAEKPWFFRQLEAGYNLLLPSRNKLPFDRSIAFLVGVAEYDRLSPQLPFVKNDLDDLREYLLNSGGFDVVYVASGAVVSQQLIDDYMLNKFPKELTHRDRLFFYYSGHGADKEGGKTGYMQFAKAERNNFAHDVMKIRDVYEWSGVINASHILFVFDACSSGLAFAPKGDGDETNRMISALSGSGSRIVMTAGTADQKTYEVKSSTGRGNGVFTRGFLDALQTGGDALLTAHAAFAAIQQRVGIFVTQSQQPLTPQIWVIDDRPGTFVFVNRAAGKKELPALYVDALKATPRSPSVPSIDRASWPLIGQDTFDGETSWNTGQRVITFQTQQAGATVEETKAIVDGSYRWSGNFSPAVLTGSGVDLTSPYQSLGNLYFAADVRIPSIAGGTLAAGLYFRATGTEGYEFLLSTNGYYYLALETLYESPTLQDWTEIPNINTSSYNRLAIEAMDERIRIYVNGKIYGEIKNGTRRFGRVGFMVRQYKDKGSTAPVTGTVEFDNIELREITASGN
jgi:hypothetical protein